MDIIDFQPIILYICKTTNEWKSTSEYEWFEIYEQQRAYWLPLCRCHCGAAVYTNMWHGLASASGFLIYSSDYIVNVGGPPLLRHRMLPLINIQNRVRIIHSEFSIHGGFIGLGFSVQRNHKYQSYVNGNMQEKLLFSFVAVSQWAMLIGCHLTL